MSLIQHIFSRRAKKRFWLALLFLFSVGVTVQGFWISGNTSFVVQNETYTVSHPMKFHTIVVADTYIVFNTTGFNVTSANPITISLHFLHSSISSATNRSSVLEYYATTSSGSVDFNISGFPINSKYDIKRGGILIGSAIADASGEISFSNSVWTTTQFFQILRNGTGPSDYIAPTISLLTILSSSPLDTEPAYGWENISCTVTDNVELSDVTITISYPNSSVTETEMSHRSGTDSYYLNTTWTAYGNYSYTIWANDTSGNDDFSELQLYSKPPNWDVNADGSCNVFDLVLLSNHYAESGSHGWIREDVDNNGVIEILDFVLVVNHYGTQWWE